MAALTIRNIDDTTKTALRVRAAQHGVSMEEEARRILRDALMHAMKSLWCFSLMCSIFSAQANHMSHSTHENFSWF